MLLIRFIVPQENVSQYHYRILFHNAVINMLQCYIAGAVTLLLFLDLPAVVQKSRGQYLHQLQLGPQPHRVRDVPLPAAGS